MMLSGSKFKLKNNIVKILSHNAIHIFYDPINILMMEKLSFYAFKSSFHFLVSRLSIHEKGVLVASAKCEGSPTKKGYLWVFDAVAYPENLSGGGQITKNLLEMKYTGNEFHHYEFH